MQVALAVGITNRKELASFMCQMQVEPRNFESFEESLRYVLEHLLNKF